MAMTLRIPAELDAQLEALATADHISKHTLLLQAAQAIVDKRRRADDISDAIEFVTTHDADLLSRLADA